jgi:hypothetical protein
MQLDLRRSKWRELDMVSKWAIVVWSLAICIPLARAALAPHASTVYVIFADAARNWSAGQDLYQFSPEPYRYSPFVAILFEPFSWLPDGLGGFVWRLGSVAILLFSLNRFCIKVLPESLSTSHKAILFLLIAPLCIGNLNNGQSNILIIGLLLAALACVMEELWNWAGFCLALACLFKIYPIALALLLILYFPRQLGLRFVGMILAGLLLPFLLQNPSYVLDQYSGWLNHLQHDDRQVLAKELWYLDLRLLWRTYVAPMSPAAYMLIQLGVGAAIGLVCWLAKKASWSRQHLTLLAFGLASCWMTVLGPASESSTYVLLAPISSWLVLKAFENKNQMDWTRNLFLLAYGLLLTSQMANWFPFGREFQHKGPQPLAAILIFVGIVIEAIPAMASSRRNIQILTSSTRSEAA